MPHHTGFAVSEEDIETVLSNHATRVANSDGRSFEEMAQALMAELDSAAIEKAALRGDDMETQTRYALEEIAQQLTGIGVLEAQRCEEGLFDSPLESVHAHAAAMQIEGRGQSEAFRRAILMEAYDAGSQGKELSPSASEEAFLAWRNGCDDRLEPDFDSEETARAYRDC
jgi:hypothetical protein